MGGWVGGWVGRTYLLSSCVGGWVERLRVVGDDDALVDEGLDFGEGEG